MALIEMSERHVSSRLLLKLMSSAMSANRKMLPSVHEMISHHQSRTEKRTACLEVSVVDDGANSSGELVDSGLHVGEVLLGGDPRSVGYDTRGIVGCVSMLSEGRAACSGVVVDGRGPLDWSAPALFGWEFMTVAGCGTDLPDDWWNVE